MKTYYFILTIFILSFSITAFSEQDEKKKTNHFAERIMSKLSEDEKAKLKELQKKDPEAFNSELKRLAKKYRQKHSPKSKEIDELLKQLSIAEDEETQNAIMSKLTDAVRKEFEETMENNRKCYEKAAKRLEELKKKMEEREANAEDIISKRVKQLTSPPSTEKGEK